jgi:thymidylate synthase (FAD)
MDNIKVKILEHNFNGTPIFLARMTQRGHLINNIDDLLKLYKDNINKTPSKDLLKLPHSTIFRMNYLTVAIYGLSTKAVSQLRTHATRLTFMSTSTQYSEFTGQECPYVIPEGLSEEQKEEFKTAFINVHNAYAKCFDDIKDKDKAGYLLPQGLRKCLVISGNFPAWQYMLSLRLCNRNTREVQYICELILDAITKECGKNWADVCLPPCVDGKCKEGKFCCGHPYIDKRSDSREN